MGFSLAFGKKAKMRKLIGNYVDDRIKEKMAFNQQMNWLNAQLHDKQIEKETYERLTEILVTQYYQKQGEQWAKIENKIPSNLNS